MKQHATFEYFKSFNERAVSTSVLQKELVPIIAENYPLLVFLRVMRASVSSRHRQPDGPLVDSASEYHGGHLGCVKLKLPDRPFVGLGLHHY